MAKKNVIVIGGGIAGMESASYLSAMGFNVTLLEKSSELGGHLLNWERLFPTMRYGKEVIDFLSKGIEFEHVNKVLNADIKLIEKKDNLFYVELNNGTGFNGDSILITTGYDLFDAHKKEEYGYGIYNNVITSADLEKIFMSGDQILTTHGKTPQRIGIVHCVGSRDEKVGHVYCSKVCCVTGVKQAIEIKEKLPDAEVFNFYMDLRMYGMHFEALYKKAQEKYGIQFIRGRLSEAAENLDGTIVLKVEDTLAGRPLKMNVDILVLLVGFVPSTGSKEIGKLMGLDIGVNGFYKTKDQHTLTNVSNLDGVFFAGTCTGPKTVTNTITDARAAASSVASYLLGFNLHNRDIENHEEFWLYDSK
ncbi:MAG: FAD-dependent oxidoreductase [Bacteroidota bacterium]